VKRIVWKKCGKKYCEKSVENMWKNCEKNNVENNSMGKCGKQ